MRASLYEHLGVVAVADADDRGRTERSAGDADTIDRDRAIVDLYTALGSRAASGGADIGRTENTRDQGETVDKDRADGWRMSTLMEAPQDLYAALTHRAPDGEAGA
jgi:hypothetical protein